MRQFLDEGIQILYRASVSRQGFPGTTPPEINGRVSTLSILEHLEIVKPSPENVDLENSSMEAHTSGTILNMFGKAPFSPEWSHAPNSNHSSESDSASTPTSTVTEFVSSPGSSTPSAVSSPKSLGPTVSTTGLTQNPASGELRSSLGPLSPSSPASRRSSPVQCESNQSTEPNSVRAPGGLPFAPTQARRNHWPSSSTSKAFPAFNYPNQPHHLSLENLSNDQIQLPTSPTPSLSYPDPVATMPFSYPSSLTSSLCPPHPLAIMENSGSIQSDSNWQSFFDFQTYPF